MNIFAELKKSSFYWDIFFFSSIIGIWPRFIEPKLLFTNRFALEAKNLNQQIRIVQVSDLHFNEQISDRYLRKIGTKINNENPHLILFTGDFICKSVLTDHLRFKNFLHSLKSTHGKFAVLGNHDYSHYVSINEEGDYDVYDDHNTQIIRGFKRICENISLSRISTPRAQALNPHEDLLNLLMECNIEVLENELKAIDVEGKPIQVVGLGEYMLGKANPEKAFTHSHPNVTTIVAVHNPDAIPKLLSYDINLILSGHTHGGQVNLPWFWKKICVLENPQFKRGLFNYGNKWIYVSRGIGGSTPFRLFAPPEITLFTLGSQK